MLGIIFLCEGKTVLVHIDSNVYIFAEIAIDVERVVYTKKLFSISGVKILEKYLRRCTFFSKVAC